jgi:hypothetical protein
MGKQRNSVYLDSIQFKGGVIMIKTEDDGTIYDVQEGEGFINIRQVYPDPVSYEEKLNEIKLQRDKLLADTDWLCIRHRDQVAIGVETALSYSQYQALLNYRQALRDLPDTVDVDNPVYPDIPGVQL